MAAAFRYDAPRMAVLPQPRRPEPRRLGRSGLETVPIGLGCWAIGGPFRDRGGWMGFGDVDDAESLRALAFALDRGVTLLDVADVYGCGHAERLVGQAIAGRPRDELILIGKGGWRFDASTRQVEGRDVSPGAIRRSCEASLRRLGTSYLDVYAIHPFDVSLDDALAARDELERLVAGGQIRSYAWCTEDPAKLRAFAEGPHCSIAPQELNVLSERRELLELADALDLGVVTRRPLAMGVLTGKFAPTATFADNDMRRRFGWDFTQGKKAAELALLSRMRDSLTARGHSLTQAAIGWIWARHPRAVPLVGFKTVAQLDESLGALDRGPLDPEQMGAIAALRQALQKSDAPA